MNKFDSLVEQATKLINTEPLPDDAEKQLQRIIDQAESKPERFMLATFAEALFVISQNLRYQTCHHHFDRKRSYDRRDC